MKLGARALAFVAAFALALSARAGDPPVHPIVVDPGHGGADFGAKGAGGVLEKDLTLAVARRLAAELRARKLPVLLTRDSDVFIPLSERTAIANRAEARFFVSIHGNSAPEAEIAGSETYFLSVEASDDEAMRVALVENDVYGQAGTAADSRDVVGQVLGDLIRTEHLRESSDLAATIQRSLAKLPDGTSRGVKQAPFVVLTGTNMPAALVEIGFVTNAAEAKRLGQKAAQVRLAEALAERSSRRWGRIAVEVSRKGDPERASTNAQPDELRTLEIELDFTENPRASVLDPHRQDAPVLCTVTVEKSVPRWLRGSGSGWVTAEYCMLPGSTDTRSEREAQKGKLSGRTQEIQRLIGRWLRAVIDLNALGERTIVIDCDVLQADGGTRTASITGGYMALAAACAAGRGAAC